MSDNQPVLRCDHSRVDAFLDADGPGLSDEEFLRHLDHCVECREYLEHEAADADVWEKLRQNLAPVEYDVAGMPEYCAGTAAISTRTNGVEAVIAALAPTDNPHNLGRLGGHEITGIVGVGGMGVVLKAVDPALDRVVAIKVMAPHLANNGTARRRFSREAKAAAAVLHPNVIPIHCVSSDEAIPHLVMAYIRGGSLQKRLDREGPLPTVEILRIGSQVAAGLAAAHDQGLVHRDIKPENILLEEGVERVTLTDFGLARAVDDVSVTREGTIAGTPQYMSPEQARGEPVDQQSDLFSLGSVLYALCTGRAPFRAESTYGIMRRISDNEPKPIRELNPDIPEWLSEIIERLMEKKKPDRFCSAEEVHKLLEACLNHVQQPTEAELPEQLNTTSPKESPLLGHPKRGRLVVGLAFIALVLAGIVFYLQTDNGTVRVEVLDESLAITIKGQTVSMQDDNRQPITLRPGENELIVKQGEIELLTQNFQLRRGDQLIFKVDLLNGNVVLSQRGKELQTKLIPDAPQKPSATKTHLPVTFQPTTVPGLQRLELPAPAVDISPDEKTALIVDDFGEDKILIGTPRIWSLETNKEVTKLPALEGFYLKLAPGSRPMCMAGDHRRQQIRFWDIENGTWFGDWIDHDLRAGFKPIFWPILSPDGKTASIASLKGEMQFWNLGGEQPVEIKPDAEKPLPKSDASEPFYVRQFSSDGEFCFAIFDAQLYVLDPTTATKIAGPFPHRRRKHLDMALPTVLYNSSSKTLVTIENSDKSSTLRFRSAIGNWEPVHSVAVTHEIGSVSFLGPHHVLSGGVGMRKVEAGGVTAQYISTIIPTKPGDTPNQVLERDAYAYAFAPDGKQWFAMNTSSVYAGWLGMDEVIWKQPLPQVLKNSPYVKYQLSIENPHWVVSHRTKNERLAIAAYASNDGRLLLNKSGLKHAVHVKSTIAVGKEVFRYAPEGLVEHSSGTQVGKSQ